MTSPTLSGQPQSAGDGLAAPGYHEPSQQAVSAADAVSIPIAGHTPTPWAYRPQEHDDWGVIRSTVATEEGWHAVVAVARYVGSPTNDDLNEHRRNKTDPSFGNAAFIVRAVNSHDDLVAALEKIERRLKPHQDDGARDDFRDKRIAHAVAVEALAALHKGASS